MSSSFCTQATTSLASTLEKCPSRRPSIKNMVTKFANAHQNLSNSYFTYSGIGDVLLWPSLTTNRNEFIVTNFVADEGGETVPDCLRKSFLEDPFEGVKELRNYLKYNVHEADFSILKIEEYMVTDDISSIASIISRNSMNKLSSTLILTFAENVLYNERRIVVNETAWIKNPPNSDVVIGYELTGAFLRNGECIIYRKLVEPLDFCINENFICLIYNGSLQRRRKRRVSRR